jgi:hypothetical protein
VRARGWGRKVGLFVCVEGKEDVQLDEIRLVCRQVVLADVFVIVWESGYRELSTERRFDCCGCLCWGRYGAVRMIASFARLLRRIARFAENRVVSGRTCSRKLMADFHTELEWARKSVFVWKIV